MVKFWTPTKLIVTILIISCLMFILFKVGLFEMISDRFLTASLDPGTSPISSVVNHGGGTR